jgi:hypothetical protein
MKLKKFAVPVINKTQNRNKTREAADTDISRNNPTTKMATMN